MWRKYPTGRSMPTVSTFPPWPSLSTPIQILKKRKLWGDGSHGKEKMLSDEDANMLVLCWLMQTVVMMVCHAQRLLIWSRIWIQSCRGWQLNSSHPCMSSPWMQQSGFLRIQCKRCRKQQVTIQILILLSNIVGTILVIKFTTWHMKRTLAFAKSGKTVGEVMAHFMLDLRYVSHEWCTWEHVCYGCSR